MKVTIYEKYSWSQRARRSQVAVKNLGPLEGGGNQGIPYNIWELQEQEWGSYRVFFFSGSLFLH